MSQVNQRTVFVVDDQQLIASTFELILRKHGFNSRAFCNPLIALEAAKSSAPDLLLTDVQMPQMNGIELALHVSECCPGCKVLLFSGQIGKAKLLAESNAKGHSFDILAKPIHPKVLIEKIEAILNGTHIGPNF